MYVKANWLNHQQAYQLLVHGKITQKPSKKSTGVGFFLKNVFF